MNLFTTKSMNFVKTVNLRVMHVKWGEKQMEGTTEFDAIFKYFSHIRMTEGQW